MDLTYETRERAPTTVELQSTPDRLTLTFPLTPRWLPMVAIAFSFVVAAIYLLGMTYVAWHDRTFLANYPIIARSLAVGVTLAAFWGLVAAFTLRSFRRAGHLPRTLIADRVARTIAYRAERSTRWRQWPLPNPSDISVRTYKMLYPREQVTTVLIHPHGKWLPIGLTFRLRDTPLADQFAMELRQFAATGTEVNP